MSTVFTVTVCSTTIGGLKKMADDQISLYVIVQTADVKLLHCYFFYVNDVALTVTLFLPPITISFNN